MWISFFFLEDGDGCYFAHGGKVTKTPPGPPSVSTFAERALIGGFPPDPDLRGRATLGCQIVPAGKIKICFRPTLGPQGPFAIKICWHMLLFYTA